MLTQINNYQIQVENCQFDDRLSIRNQMQNLGFKYLTYVFLCGEKYSLRSEIFYSSESSLYKIAYYGGCSSHRRMMFFRECDIENTIYDFDGVIEVLFSKKFFYFNAENLYEKLLQAETKSGHEDIVAHMLLLGMDVFVPVDGRE